MKRETLNRLGIGAKKDILPEDVLNPGINLKFYGLSEKDGEKLCVLRDFVKEYNAERPMRFKKTSVNNSGSAADLLRDRIGDLDTEEVWVAFLNKKLSPLAVERMFAGKSDMVICDKRQIIKRALNLNASRIILYHNHPSGDSRPSPQDITETELLHKACDTMDMKLIDHIIIASEEYYSFSDKATTAYNQ